MKKAMAVLGAALLGLLAIGALVFGANHAFSKSRTETRPVAGDVRAVVIDDDRGDVRLVSGARRVEVRETRHYVGRKPKVTRRLRDGVLTLESSCSGLGVLKCATDYRVAVPAGVPVQVDTDAGDVSGESLQLGDVRVTTNVGDVDLDFAARPARVEGRTDVGDVEISVPRAAYAVDADNDVGDTSVHGVVADDRAPRSIRANTNVGDLSVHAR
jgi:hypothetical protein